jgi:hypothetical protein
MIRGRVLTETEAARAVEFLLNHGANALDTNARGFDALDYAREQKLPKIIQILEDRIAQDRIARFEEFSAYCGAI